MKCTLRLLKIALRKDVELIATRARIFPVGKRSLSTEQKISDWVTSSCDDDGVVVLRMNRPPANSLSLEMVQAISKAIKDAEENPKSRALILTSGLEKIFSAGLDLSELYRPDAERLPVFWGAFQQLYLDLYGCRLPTTAAISGHAPAAGCMLALSCDYRIMTTAVKGSIGLNESILGIVAPPWLGRQFIDTVGHRQAEMALSLGTLFSPAKALEIGLLDELVPNNIMEVARDRALHWASIPREGLIGAKRLTRAPQMQDLIENRQADSDAFCSFVTQEHVQETIGEYLEQLARRKK